MSLLLPCDRNSTERLPSFFSTILERNESSEVIHEEATGAKEAVSRALGYVTEIDAEGFLTIVRDATRA